ncbi:MAG: type II toxin-antitoxin system VapC family toxin [Zoogloeaceae bacterium]|jgi:predicted nucleic acid-binding protein|nr:type II toxin-antitoxin system VapC family toxin [Zoogloeaceae bacterium]
MSIVLDASLALAWIFERPTPAEATRADRVLDEAHRVELSVPLLWHTEVANALLVGERRKIVTEAAIIDYLARLDSLPIVADSVHPAMRRNQIMALARQYGLSAYDASYLELALRKGAMLATFDRKLLEAMKSAGGCVFE